MLSGITMPQFYRAIWRHREAIDWSSPCRHLRLAFLFFMAIPNTILALIEHFLFNNKIEGQPLNQEPIIILGHPRTGTTLLQNLLCQDATKFAYCNTFQAGFPSHFLVTQRFKWMLSWLVDSTRPMDNMELSFETPAEDEIAVNMISGGTSPYMCLVFMTKFKYILRYATFDDGVCTAEEKAAWTTAFLYFLKKITLSASKGNKEDPPKPLIIKSPVHIGRLRVLRTLFPRAKYIFIHRSPADVFASSVILAEQYNTFCYLDTPSPAQITDYILEQHALLHGVYLQERGKIPKGHLVEVSFEELEKDPVQTMRRVYSELEMGDGFEERVAPVLNAYCCRAAVQGFVKNKHDDGDKISSELRERLQKELGPVAAAFGYSL